MGSVGEMGTKRAEVDNKISYTGKIAVLQPVHTNVGPGFQKLTTWLFDCKHSELCKKAMDDLPIFWLF